MAEAFVIVLSSLTLIHIKKEGKDRYYQAPRLTHDSNDKVTTLQLDITNESQEVSSFPAGEHKANINRLTQRHSKRKTEKT